VTISEILPSAPSLNSAHNTQTSSGLSSNRLRRIRAPIANRARIPQALLVITLAEEEQLPQNPKKNTLGSCLIRSLSNIRRREDVLTTVNKGIGNQTTQSLSQVRKSVHWKPRKTIGVITIREKTKPEGSLLLRQN
jgi:hypothetical protein